MNKIIRYKAADQVNWKLLILGVSQKSKNDFLLKKLADAISGRKGEAGQQQQDANVSRKGSERN